MMGQLKPTLKNLMLIVHLGGLGIVKGLGEVVFLRIRKFPETVL